MDAIRRSSHEASRDRLTANTIFAAANGLPPNLAAYAEYERLLREYQYGRATSWEVGLARVRWCAEESKLVDARRSQPKPMEGMAEWGRKVPEKGPRRRRRAVSVRQTRTRL